MESEKSILRLVRREFEWKRCRNFSAICFFDKNIFQFFVICTGKEEALAAGKAVKDAGLKFDVAHTSVLTRAQVTLNSILTESGQAGIPIEKTWRLNERHYGGLTGLNKSETAAKYGEEQVQIWRRSYDTPPPGKLWIAFPIQETQT